MSMLWLNRCVSGIVLFCAFSCADVHAQFKRNLTTQIFAPSSSFQMPSTWAEVLPSSDSYLHDSTRAETPMRALKLLPDHLTIFESVLWGSTGVFRRFSPLTPEARRRELDFRRTMLSTHQVLGFATLALMTASVVFGQILLNDYEALRFEEALRNRQTHRTLSIITFGTYMSTAAMSTFAPPPLIRRDEWNTVSTHKLLAIFHFSGMVAQPILAIMASNSRDLEQIRTLRRAHQIVGYFTLAVLAAAMLTLTF
jgi:hypothetical protein